MGGVRLAWVIDAERRCARVYRADGSVSLLDAGEVLSGEDLLPGFRLTLKELW